MSNLNKEIVEPYANATTEELQTWYANAHNTYCMCLGHGKSSRNEYIMTNIKEEMERRDMQPDGREGEFNGEGSS